MAQNFVFGSTRVKPSKFGDWSIKEFVVTEFDAEMFNFRQKLQGRSNESIEAGTYTRLVQQSTGYAVMSNTPMELNTNRIAYENAHGNVLIAGLGMGMILDALLSKQDVTRIKIIEVDKDVIDYVGGFYKDEQRVEIIHADIRSYQPSLDEFYDYIWLDIWDNIDERNIDEMIELNGKFAKHCSKMNIWSMDLIGCDPDDYYKIAL